MVSLVAMSDGASRGGMVAISAGAAAVGAGRVARFPGLPQMGQAMGALCKVPESTAGTSQRWPCGQVKEDDMSGLSGRGSGVSSAIIFTPEQPASSEPSQQMVREARERRATG
jgi:hypothetical protein